jgi:integrase
MRTTRTSSIATSKYGPTKLSELSPHDLRKSLDRLHHTPTEQQHAFVVLRAFIRWAHRKHYCETNPMERMQAPWRYIPRERVLTGDELRAVWLAAGNDTFGRIVKLLILTGQRVGEITKLTGTMVADDTITLPAWLAKNSREHTFPLGAIAKAILGETPDRDTCVFPALGKKTPFNGHSPCKRGLDKRCHVSDWTLHDLRRTFATGLASPSRLRLICRHRRRVPALRFHARNASRCLPLGRSRPRAHVRLKPHPARRLAG